MNEPAIDAGWFMVTRTGSPMGRLIRLLTHSPVNHAGVSIGYGNMVEMVPSGACVSPDSAYPQAIWIRPPGTAGQLEAMADAASDLMLRHVGYSMVDIAAQFAWRILHVRPALLARFISSDRRMVCSQSVDWCALQAGVHLFGDGRLPGLVAPSDLLLAAQDNGWPCIVQPAVTE